MICLMLLAYAKRKPKKGRVASLYLMFYGIGRFGVEFLRSDYRGSVIPFYFPVYFHWYCGSRHHTLSDVAAHL